MRANRFFAKDYSQLCEGVFLKYKLMPCTNFEQHQECDFSGFFLNFRIFSNLPLPHNFLERREVASHQGKKEVACIVSKPLVSCLWGCGDSVNPPKLNIQEVQGALSSRSKGDPGLLPIFQEFLLLSNHTPAACNGCFNHFASVDVYTLKTIKRRTCIHVLRHYSWETPDKRHCKQRSSPLVLWIFA